MSQIVYLHRWGSAIVSIVDRKTNLCCQCTVKVAGATNMSVDFFPDNMLGNVELNVDTTNNHPALTSYFANPSIKKTVLTS